MNMCRHITLDAWVSVDFPGAPNVVLEFEDGMIYEFLQFGKFMLDLVGQYQSRKPSSNGHDPQSTIRVRRFIDHGNTNVCELIDRRHDEEPLSSEAPVTLKRRSEGKRQSGEEIERRDVDDRQDPKDIGWQVTSGVFSLE